MKITRENLREIMQTAWKVSKDTGGEFGLSLQLAWRAFKLKRKLRSGVTTFYFIKKSTGELRRAVGTLKDTAQFIKGTGRPQTNLALVNYYDMEKNGWRATRVENLLTVA